MASLIEYFSAAQPKPLNCERRRQVKFKGYFLRPHIRKDTSTRALICRKGKENEVL